jgi:hypothetical protein
MIQRRGPGVLPPLPSASAVWIERLDDAPAPDLAAHRAPPP